MNLHIVILGWGREGCLFYSSIGNSRINDKLHYIRRINATMSVFLRTNIKL